MKNIGKGFVIFAIISAIIFVCGCMEDHSPARISFSASAKEGDFLKLYFSIEDSRGRPVYCNGDAKIEIKDDLGNLLYSNTFHVKAKDFNYPYNTDENITVMCCEISIPLSEIKEGTSQIGIGKAYITFKTTKGITLKTEIPV